MKVRNRALAEIIIIGIFAVSAVLAAALAVHNVRELSDARAGYDAMQKDRNELAGAKKILELENEVLTTENNDLADLVASLNEENRTLFNELQKARETPKNQDTAGTSQRENAHLERLPEGHTNVISGMPYTTITDKKSEQWALQLQAFTGEYGIRCYSDGDCTYFLAAMGSAYGREIGTAFRITLKCGTELYVMLGEFKDDGTDPSFFGHPTKHADGYDVTCVLEFIYDAEHINSKALQAGNFCNIEYFGGLHGDGGDIVKIENLGRKWEP